jgi:ferric-chelate reductase
VTFFFCHLNHVILCLQLLWTSRAGITGIIAFIVTPFIVLPMTVPYLKKRISFEWRKFLHYLCILWGVALMYHAPQRIFWLIGIPIFIYLSDKILEGLFRCHLVESAHFQRLGDSSCLISFENPPGFGKQNSAYVYLMLPWLSKYQFHAFTVFPSTKPNHSSICIHKCGDWTGKLMDTITIPTHKPSFVVGPFLSPFSSPAMDSENLVAVATGIGVTPAISLIKQYSSTSRRLNLVWICRDAGLVEHFLQNVDFGHDGYTLIYYTGRRSLILRDDIPANVFIFNSRPNLERTISGIIISIAAGTCLPEELNEKVLSRTPAEMRSKLLLEKALSLYTLDQLFEYTAKASAYYNAETGRDNDVVNYCGVRSTIRHLLGQDYEMVTNKMNEYFEKVDDDGDDKIDRAGFEIFFKLMLEGSDAEEKSSIVSVKRGLRRRSACQDMFEPSKYSQSEHQKDEFGIKEYLQGEGKFSAKNWNILYCGGSQAVLDQLKDFKRKFGVGLSVEKFDW